jgi:hypothetical protein
MNKHSIIFNKTLVIGCIAISFLIVLASLPSVFAGQTYKNLEITYKIREQLEKELKKIKGGSFLPWTPGLILNVFLITLNLYIDFLRNNSWFPGLTLIMTYLFLVLVLFSLI